MKQFLSWLSSLSFSRVIGRLLGNTTDLEREIQILKQVLTDQRKDFEAQAKAINLDREWIQSRYERLEDRFLLKEGSYPISAPIPGTTEEQQIIGVTAKRKVSDEVKEIIALIGIDPEEADERLQDLQEEQTPESIEILAQFAQWIEAQPIAQSSTTPYIPNESYTVLEETIS